MTFVFAGDGSSSDVVGQLLSSSSVDAASGTCIDAGTGASAMHSTSLSPVTSFVVTESTQSSILAPSLNIQQPRACAVSSDSDNTPVSPVRNSSARSTPIAIGAPRYALSVLTASRHVVQ